MLFPLEGIHSPSSSKDYMSPCWKDMWNTTAALRKGISSIWEQYLQLWRLTNADALISAYASPAHVVHMQGELPEVLKGAELYLDTELNLEADRN
jgi:hypothetical protein